MALYFRREAILVPGAGFEPAFAMKHLVHEFLFDGR
jgi:hypothetical protein